MPKITCLLKQKKPGIATLVAVSVVMFTSLLVGLAVSQRAGSGIRRSTYTAQTDQAFSCATSGVEAALLCISQQEDAGNDPSASSSLCNGGASSASTTGNLGDTCRFEYNVLDLTGPDIRIDLLEKDSVQQFDVGGVNGNLSIEFGVNDPNDPTPGIEISYIFQNGSDYEMDKWAYSCGTASSDSNGFVSLSGAPLCTATVPLGGHANSVIRVRSFFSGIQMNVTGLGNAKQGYLIESSGIAGSVTRNVEVLRMNPQLPAIFDYVLYSEEGSITKN